MDKRELCNRWVSLIRDKAIQYEAEQRKQGKGEEVTSPDLLDIANEIAVFFVGLEH